MPTPSGESPRDKKVSYLVVGVLLLAVVAAGAYLMLGRDLKSAHGAVGPGAGKSFFSRLAAYLPGKGTAATNDGQRTASEYSPIVPINEAKRVKSVVRDRVGAGQQEPEGATNTVAVTPVAPVLPAVPAATSTTVAVAGTGTAPAKPNPAGRLPGTGPAGAGTAVEKPFVWPDLKVTAAIGDRQGKWFARINGRLLTVGDTAEGTTVVAISAQRVIMGYGELQHEYYVGSGR